MFRAPVLVACFLLASCAPQDPGRPAPASLDLLPTVQAEMRGDSVHFVLQVTNTTTAPAALTFATGQSYDFVVKQADREIWRWSTDRSFTQSLRDEQLAPGETRRYDASWAPPAGSSGEFVVDAVMLLRDRPVAQSTRFRL
jgi:hypothetical protein